RRCASSVKCWHALSDHKIPQHCGVSHTTVLRRRKELFPSGNLCQIPTRTVERNPTQYEMDTSRIGQQQPQPPIGPRFLPRFAPLSDLWRPWSARNDAAVAVGDAWPHEKLNARVPLHKTHGSVNGARARRVDPPSA